MGHLTPKINITFFITNLRLNIFTVNNFFGKPTNSKETAKNCSGGAHFWSPVCNNFNFEMRFFFFLVFLHLIQEFQFRLTGNFPMNASALIPKYLS